MTSKTQQSLSNTTRVFRLDPTSYGTTQRVEGHIVFPTRDMPEHMRSGATRWAYKSALEAEEQASNFTWNPYAGMRKEAAEIFARLPKDHVIDCMRLHMMKNLSLRNMYDHTSTIVTMMSCTDGVSRSFWYMVKSMHSFSITNLKGEVFYLSCYREPGVNRYHHMKVYVSTPDTSDFYMGEITWDQPAPRVLMENNN